MIVVDGERGDGPLGWADVEADEPGLRRRGRLARDRARGPAHADLHLGHDRPAQGRRARPPQPAGRRPGVEELIELPRRLAVISWLPNAHIAERNAHHYLPIVYALTITTCAEPARDRRLPAGGAADLVLRGAAHLGEAQGRPGGDGPGPGEERRAEAGRARRPRREKVRLEQAGEPVPDELAATVARGRRGVFSPGCGRCSASTRSWRSTSAPRRRRSRCSSSSTRSACRSPSCGA